MAKNKPYGDNARVGAVKGRSQVYNPKTDSWVHINCDMLSYRVFIIPGISQKGYFRNFKGSTIIRT